MGYSSLAQRIRNNVSSVEQDVSKMKSVSLDSVWSGEAHDEITSNLKTSLSVLEKQIESTKQLANALDSLQKYKDNDKRIDSLRSSLNSLPNTEEYASKRSYYSNEINSLQSTNSSLKSSINSTLGYVSSVSTQFTLVDYQPSNTYGEYVVDLNELLALFKSGSLTQLSDSNRSSDSLYDYYSKEEVSNVMSDIKQKYSGRGAAVNCALGVMNMAAQVGVKLDYDLLRGSNKLLTEDGIATGSDCVSFASWAISQGSDKVDKTYSTSEFVKLGNKINYSQAQPGDVFTLKYEGSGGHVMLVVENHPEKGTALVAEAKGKNKGIELTEIKYSLLEEKRYTARDLTDFYS